MQKPNIIFILADDMGYGDASCYRAKKIHTPHIDRLAEEGIRFIDAHSSSAVCTPSRYSVITGRYCWRSSLKNGVLGGHGRPIIEKDRTTAASILKENGYKTAAFGKWHLGLDWVVKPDHELKKEFDGIQEKDPFMYDYSKPFSGGPTELGFNYFYGIAGSLDMPPYCFLENDQTIGIPDREKKHYYPQQRKGLQTEDWDDLNVDRTFVSKAKEYIKKQVSEKPDQPFFTYLALAAPHRPCLPPDFIKDKSRAGNRGDMVTLVDWAVGEIDNTLKKLGIKDNTLLVFTSDNGARPCDVDGNMYGHKSCGDLRGYKADIWDGGHREPFIISWPGMIKNSQTSDALVSLMDFTATCADIVGYNLDENEAEDSISLLPIITGMKKEVRQSLVHHSFDGMFSLRKGNWKYIEGLGSGGFSIPKRYQDDILKGQLYDLSQDPREISNLYLHKPDIVKTLQEELDNIR